MKNAQRSMKIGAITALAVACLCFSVQAQAPVDTRVALVIGNSAYTNAPLVNPANDARAMGDTLRGLGFTVVELRDAQKEQMTEAIAKVRDALKGKQGVGMLYYAGHGLQLDWHNYMVPVNAKLVKASDVPEQAIDVNSVIDAFKSAGNRMNILVLDACRDNPFAGTASGKGLAQLDAPPGTLLAYATAPGNVAEDSDAKGGNGLYTSYLLQELKNPQAKIEDVLNACASETDVNGKPRHERRLEVTERRDGKVIYWDFRVMAFENITVPAGTFKAYPIEGTSRTSSGGYQTETYWIDPQRMLILKDAWTYWNSAKQLTDSYVRELFSARRG